MVSQWTQHISLQITVVYTALFRISKAAWKCVLISQNHWQILIRNKSGNIGLFNICFLYLYRCAWKRCYMISWIERRFVFSRHVFVVVTMVHVKTRNGVHIDNCCSSLLRAVCAVWMPNILSELLSCLLNELSVPLISYSAKCFVRHTEIVMLSSQR